MTQFTLLLIIITIGWATLTSLSALAQSPASTPPAPISRSSVSLTTATQGTDLEQQKLDVERLKAWLTFGSILVPLITGMGAIYWQVRSATQLKETEAKSAFELKAAEIVLSSSSPAAAVGRAKVLADLFPHRLPPKFASSFDSTSFPALCATRLGLSYSERSSEPGTQR